MITGRLRNPDEPIEFDPDQVYSEVLDKFEGIEGKYYGISDKIFNLKKLIEVTRQMVLTEEADYREIQKQEQTDEFYQFPTTNELTALYKNSFRQFTYKSLYQLIQSVFEEAINELYDILVEEQQMKEHRNPSSKNKIKDILDGFTQLDPAFDGLYPKVQPFIFVRNKISHKGGVFAAGGSHTKTIIAQLESWTSISIEDMGTHNGKKKYKVIIKHSSLLIDYLNTIDDLFKQLLTVARKRKASRR